MTVEDRLTGSLREGPDLERRATNSIPIETTVIQDRRGIVATSASELDEFSRILANQKLVELANKVDEVNPKQKEASTSINSNVFEI